MCIQLTIPNPIPRTHRLSLRTFPIQYKSPLCGSTPLIGGPNRLYHRHDYLLRLLMQCIAEARFGKAHDEDRFPSVVWAGALVAVVPRFCHSYFLRYSFCALDGESEERAGWYTGDVRFWTDVWRDRRDAGN
jgi:hypothetical protein